MSPALLRAGPVLQYYEIFDLADFNCRAMCLVVTLDRGFIRVAAVNSDRLGESMTADRLRQGA